MTTTYVHNDYDNDHDDDDQERAGSASRSRPAPPSSCSGAEQEMEPQVGQNHQYDRDYRDCQVVADHGQGHGNQTMKLEDSETTSPLTTCDRYPCLLEL